MYVIVYSTSLNNAHPIIRIYFIKHTAAKEVFSFGDLIRHIIMVAITHTLNDYLY